MSCSVVLSDVLVNDVVVFRRQLSRPTDSFIHPSIHSFTHLFTRPLCIDAVAARSPVVSEDVTQLTRVKSSPLSSCELFSRKIESERPIAIIRTDSDRHVTCSHPQLLYSNTFVPISVSEQLTYSDDELTTYYNYQTLQLLQSSDQQAPVFSETVSIDASDNRAVAVELLKLKKSTLDVQQKALPQGYKMVAEVTGPQTFSETLAIDACDYQTVGVELLKKKKSTLDVQQKALPQGYVMVADVSGPQTFSETVSIDSEDRRQVGIELLKRKTSAMDVQRKALPRGVKLEAEVLEAKTETTKVYVARTKCIEATVETPSEQLDEGAAPVFVVQLQSLQTMDGGKARLVCRVRGRPMPVCTEWSRNGKIIAADCAEFMATYDKSSGDASLTIAEVFPEDAGVYECFAENEHGQARTKAELTVEGTTITTYIVVSLITHCFMFA